MTVVSISGLTKTFTKGNVTALEGIDLEIAAGEFVSLIGPSGCGKSTMLRVIGDLTASVERHGSGEREERSSGSARP